MKLPEEYFGVYASIFPEIHKKWIIEDIGHAIIYYFAYIKYGTPDGIWIISDRDSEILGQTLVYVPDKLLLSVRIIQRSVTRKEVDRVGFCLPEDKDRLIYVSEF